jgi:hypothetical protein
MALYRVLEQSYINGGIVEAGDEVTYDGRPGSNLEPLDEEAHEAFEASMQYEAQRDRAEQIAAEIRQKILDADNAQTILQAAEEARQLTDGLSAGSGQSIADAISEVAPLINPVNVALSIGDLVANAPAEGGEHDPVPDLNGELSPQQKAAATRAAKARAKAAEAAAEAGASGDVI